MLGPTTEKQRTSLERITACSAHLLEMIEDVLSFARVESNAVQANPERVDVDRLAREVAAIVEPLAVRKGLGVRVVVPDAALAIETDAAKLRQILLNLMGNAVKFTEAGEVRLEACADPDDGARVRLRVQDTGIGIPQQDLERIFEPFVQSEAVLTRRFGGTGLGLPISRALAVLLGGTLTTESAPGEGATFTLTLPRSPGAPVGGHASGG